jgi:hypothetical protein
MWITDTADSSIGDPLRNRHRNAGSNRPANSENTR